MTFPPSDNPQQNCNSRFLLLFSAVLCLGRHQGHCAAFLGTMDFHRFDNAASFSLGSVSRAVHSSGFCNLQRLPLDERPPWSSSQSGPVLSRSRRHPKASQQCQRWTDQENGSKAAREVRPCSVPSGVMRLKSGVAEGLTSHCIITVIQFQLRGVNN